MDSWDGEIIFELISDFLRLNLFSKGLSTIPKICRLYFVESGDSDSLIGFHFPFSMFRGSYLWIQPWEKQLELLLDSLRSSWKYPSEIFRPFSTFRLTKISFRNATDGYLPFETIESSVINLGLQTLFWSSVAKSSILLLLIESFYKFLNYFKPFKLFNLLWFKLNSSILE